MKGSLLAFTDDSVLSINIVSTAVSELGIQGVEQCDPKIITQASSFESVEFLTDWLFEEILRVLKPGGTILIHKNPQSTMGETDKINSTLKHKLLLAGLLEVGVLKSMVSSEVQSFGVNLAYANLVVL
uniref:Anamorsin N-terminal domain-containing protein n=1 Tax=Quercus lobata TaxID=97700 RepID=A0A7N2MKV4_QUELO